MAQTKATPPDPDAPPGKPTRRRVTSNPAAKSEKAAAKSPLMRRGKGKERILAAALDLFANKGFDAVSTADVAQQAGSSQSVVLYHFGTKDELWRAAMRDLFRTVAIKPTFDGAMYKDLDAVSRLRVLLRSFVLTSARHPELGRVINREGSSSSERMMWLFQELARPNYAAFEALFVEGARSGLLKSYPAPMLTLLAHGAAATLFNLGSIAQMLLDGDPFAQDVVELQADLVVDIILNGLTTKGPS
ncbi:TetR/AcrR family transcriptional regulator [Sphingomonas bacterium]|uniref:TetR/AcrR family transcriptional regulator n=1 Tax=Sphingomonas bacterium TaxID=1895847 RepID=UPI001575324E|nr:TetR/AcrR family transcriptional regulator [Sphingomonas bacterium]